MAGVIHSPKWPEDYDNDEECLWDIQISQEHSSRALAPVGDYYFLFEDEEAHAPLCGITLPKAFRSESNRIRLNFTTDESTTAAGFRAEWKAECGAVFRLSHGVISSPNYPSHYPNVNARCEYMIAPEGEAANSVIALKLIDFDLSDAKMDYSRSPCASDYLEIRDVSNNRVVMTYCGGDPMSEEPIAIKGAVGISFVTNESYIDGKVKLQKGFQISYAIDRCGGSVELTEEKGYSWTITSPAFPLDYAHNLDCVWNITAPSDRVITAKYEVMELEASSDCGFDSVELIDGADLNGTSMGKVCGSKEQMPKGRLYTKSNNLLVHFVTDHTLNEGRFKIAVTATLGEKSGCGGTLKATGDWGTVKPPLDKNADCGDWLVAKTESQTFTYQSKQSKGCNRTVITQDVPSGRLTSPNFPNPYDHNSTCTTRLEAPERKRILLVFRSFDFERGRVNFYRTNGSRIALYNWRRRVFMRSCDFDYMKISEPGRNSTGPVCGRGLPSTYFSWGNSVEVFMKTDHNMATEGYDLSYFTGKLRDDGSIDFAPSYDLQGAITNIGYPRGYNTSTKTSWTIKPPNGHGCIVELVVLELAKAPEGVDCLSQDEYLEIEQSTGNPEHPGGGTDSARVRSCSHTTPMSLEMEPGANRHMKFTFKSDAGTENDGTGFRLTWKCLDYQQFHLN
ncbi:CUB domain protein [Ancylostoma duodenale]|uniref:CUB domain protein n=1 Tax=Ancylostoma duodenale TaxID=51022 RepID=A0A0C2GLZ6_9BILA|nr:CUB domain protein [Ancylostoma duodenale]